MVPSLRSTVFSPGWLIEVLRMRDDAGLRLHIFHWTVDRRPETEDNVHD